MKIEIKNFGKFRKFDKEFEDSAVNTISALNGEGKSTLAAAIAYAFCPQEWLKLSQIQRNKFAPYNAAGADSKGMRISVSAGKAVLGVLDSKTAGISMAGWECHAAAVGLMRLSQMSQVEVLRVCSELMAPDYNSAVQEFFAGENSQMYIDLFNARVEKFGAAYFDELEKDLAVDTKAGKQIWSRLTGDAYGGVKAASWVPLSIDGTVSPDYDDLLAAVSRETSVLEKMKENLRKGSVTREALGKLIADDSKEAELLPARKKARAAADDKCARAAWENTTAQAEFDKVDAILDRMEKAAKNPTLSCPNCGTDLVLLDGKLGAFDGHTSREGAEKMLDTWRKEYKRNNSRLIKSNSACVAAQDDLTQATQLYQRSENAAARLERHKADLENLVDGVSEEEVIKQRDKVAAIQIAINARQEHNKIAVNARLLDGAKPQGIRKIAMRGVIGKINSLLAAVVDTFGNCIDLDGNVNFCGIPISRCSTGEKYLVDAVFAAMVTIATNSSIVIFDGVEVLDAGMRDIFIEDVVNPLVAGGQTVLIMEVGKGKIE